MFCQLLWLWCRLWLSYVKSSAVALCTWTNFTYHLLVSMCDSSLIMLIRDQVTIYLVASRLLTYFTCISAACTHNSLLLSRNIINTTIWLHILPVVTISFINHPLHRLARSPRLPLRSFVPLHLHWGVVACCSVLPLLPPVVRKLM